jgi:hypothetical protein
MKIFTGDTDIFVFAMIPHGSEPLNYSFSCLRDVNVQFDDNWLSTRNTSNDTNVLADFILKFNGEGRS